MITVIVPTHNDEEPLAHMLPPLVTHAVTGTVSQLIVHDGGSTDGTARVADVAGADFKSSKTPLADVLDTVRAPWLLVLPPGAVLEGNWEHVVTEHLNSARGPRTLACFNVLPDRSRALWKRVLFPKTKPKTPLANGLLVATSTARQSLKGRTTAKLEDVATGRAIMRLRAGISFRWA
ncbi:MAG: glycosyl transferase family 2 [Pseudomonadota bacterium]